MELGTFILKLRQNRIFGVSLAVALLAGAVLLRMATPITMVYATFYPAVVLAAIASGWILALGAIAASVIAAAFFFIPRDGSFLIGTTDALNMIGFAIVSLFLVALVELLMTLLRDAHDRKAKMLVLNERLAASESQQQILARELAHRLKNQYTVILSVLRTAIRKSTSLEEFEESFTGKLLSMSRANDLLTKSGWQEVPLSELIESELRPFSQVEQLEVAGPNITLPSEAVVGIGLALHELATNSVKHGAWSEGAGRVTLSWSVEHGTICFRWQEADGPRVSVSERHGFGRLLLERLVPATLHGTAVLDFAPAGLSWTLKMPLGSALGSAVGAAAGVKPEFQA